MALLINRVQLFFLLVVSSATIYMISNVLRRIHPECPSGTVYRNRSLKNSSSLFLEPSGTRLTDENFSLYSMHANLQTPEQDGSVISSSSISPLLFLSNNSKVHFHPKFSYIDASPFSSSYLSSPYLVSDSLSSAFSDSARIANLDIGNRFYFPPSLDTPEDFAAEALRVEIFHRMKSLQHPDVSTCPNASYLVCNMESSCGFICSFHQIMHCVSRAQQQEKTAVVPKDRILNGGKWSSWFEPISSCQEYFWKNHAQADLESFYVKTHLGKNLQKKKDAAILDVEYFSPSVDPWMKNRYSVPSYMKKVVNRESMLYLGAWYLGVYEWYVLNLNDRMKEFIQMKKEEMKLEAQHCDVGLQIRRTDKIGWGEMDQLHVREYMREVDHFAVPGRNFHNIFPSEEKHFNKTVYLATDDPNVINELKYWLPVYRFVNNQVGSQSAFMSIHTGRISDTKGIDHLLYDIFSVVSCDDFVGTFTSNVGQIIVELQAMRYLNPAAHSSSLDSVWYGRV